MEHALAQEHLWPYMINFLKRHITHNENTERLQDDSLNSKL